MLEDWRMESSITNTAMGNSENHITHPNYSSFGRWKSWNSNISTIFG